MFSRGSSASSVWRCSGVVMLFFHQPKPTLTPGIQLISADRGEECSSLWSSVYSRKLLPSIIITTNLVIFIDGFASFHHCLMALVITQKHSFYHPGLVNVTISRRSVNPDTWKLRKVTYYIWTTIFVCNVRCPWTDCGRPVGRRVSGVGWRNQTQYSHDLRQTTHQIKYFKIQWVESNMSEVYFCIAESFPFYIQA